MTTAIEAEGLTKYYGKAPGIVDLDLEVFEGEVFGFLGPNGAGKSTTIRTLLDLLHPTRGSARILGLDSRRDSVAVRRRVGYLPGDLAMYEDMTARQMLLYFSALRGVDTVEEIRSLAERLDLDLDRKIGSYSSGNRQKVGIVQAFMHRPDLLILDEPSTGLDPLMQQEFYRMIDEVRSDGRTVFLSSHVLPEVERIAGRVGIVRNSRLVTVEEVERLKARAVRRLQIVFSNPVPAAEFADLAGVQRVTGTHDGRGIDVSVEGSVDAVLKQASRHRMENVITHEGDLEEAFLAYYRDDADDAA